MKPGFNLEIPGREALRIRHLLLDFTGTLSRDGQLLPDVATLLVQIARFLDITVLTADTFGTARQVLSGLPIDLHLIETGIDKVEYIQQIDAGTTAAIGNGFNDCGMLREAALGIAVIGPESASAALILCADLVTTSITDALELFLFPLRLKAALRA